MLHRGPQFPADLSGRFDLLMNEYEQVKGIYCAEMKNDANIRRYFYLNL